MERFDEAIDDGAGDGFEIDDLVSGRSLTRCDTLEGAVDVVRAMAECWPGSEDEVVILPVGVGPAAA